MRARPRAHAAHNAQRARYSYVVTTGGIGPTHDDITADCVAKAFGVTIDYDPRASARTVSDSIFVPVASLGAT